LQAANARRQLLGKTYAGMRHASNGGNENTTP
jgi:hypothetical protein